MTFRVIYAQGCSLQHYIQDKNFSKTLISNTGIISMNYFMPYKRIQLLIQYGSGCLITLTFFTNTYIKWRKHLIKYMCMLTLVISGCWNLVDFNLYSCVQCFSKPVQIKCIALSSRYNIYFVGNKNRAFFYRWLSVRSYRVYNKKWNKSSLVYT